MPHSVTMTCHKACFRENQKYLILSTMTHLTFVSIKSESNIKIATKHRHICHVSLSSRWKFHNFNHFSVEVSLISLSNVSPLQTTIKVFRHLIIREGSALQKGEGGHFLIKCCKFSFKLRLYLTMKRYPNVSPKFDSN